jgi:osmoprotectant transport system ATP-binding protein
MLKLSMKALEGNRMLTYQGVSKFYPGGVTALAGFSLDVQEGEFVVLIGPSGSGKTTALKMVNRLIEPSEGTILLDGQDIRQIDPYTLRHQIGYALQGTGLFPHLTVADNIAIVPEVLGWSKQRRRSRVGELLELAGLDPDAYRDRYPHELSGGQQQRVGVLRALAADPPIILMDEPFGALDPITRADLQEELRWLQRTVQKTILFVTHDIQEALGLGDRIVVMREGRIVQSATPRTLMDGPADPFVAEFIRRAHLNLRPAPLQLMPFVEPSAAVPNRAAVYLSVDDAVHSAVVRMNQLGVSSLPVRDGAKVVGIVRLGRLAEALATHVWGDEPRLGETAD